MTESVKTKAEEFRQVILESEEYRNYDMYRRLLNEQPELKEKVDKFREMNFSMQITRRDESRDVVQSLASEYADVLTNSVVKEYLNAELVLCKMIQQINAILLADVELELDFS